MARVYLGLGSNLGERRLQMRAAVRALRDRGVSVIRASSLYETEPMYELDQPRFLNAVVEAETELSPRDLMRAIKGIEVLLGRQRRQRNGPREIDIDILVYDDVQIDTPELTIPHPRMTERPFVMAPLGEVWAPIGPRPSGDISKEMVDPHPSPLPGRERGQVRDLYKVDGPEWAQLPSGQDSSLRSE